MNERYNTPTKTPVRQEVPTPEYVADMLTHRDNLMNQVRAIDDQMEAISDMVQKWRELRGMGR